MSINRVNISGHLTRDPELRMTPKGTQVLSFGIAVNDRRLNRETNQWEDYPKGKLGEENEDDCDL